MSVLSKIVHALFSDDDTPSIYFALISREYNGGLRKGETRFTPGRGDSSEATRVTFRPVEPAYAASLPDAGGATEDVTLH